MIQVKEDCKWTCRHIFYIFMPNYLLLGIPFNILRCFGINHWDISHSNDGDVK